MRPVAALLLGGLISCCSSGGTASAQSAGTAQAIESPTDSVRRQDPSMPPAHALDSPSVLFAAGVFALVEAYDYPYSFGVTFVARPLTYVAPVTRCGLRRRARRHCLHVRGRAPRLRARPALVLHAEPCGRLVHQRRRHRTARSPGVPERHPICAAFRQRAALGLAGLHISNGGLEHPNNGTEAVLLTLQVPLHK